MSAASHRGRAAPEAESNAPVRQSHDGGTAVKARQRDELRRIVAGIAEVGELLSDLGPDDVDRALAVVFAARSQLERTERQLVRLARHAGGSWARIGAAMGICSARATHARFGGTQ
jgi:hypothetical protein